MTPYFAEKCESRPHLSFLFAEKMYLCLDKPSGMSQRFTYSIPPHALPSPATADRICVAEPRPHTSGVRHLPCGPLTTEPCRPTACNPCGYPRLTARYSLFPANSTDATPAPPAHPILHSSFFILNWAYTFSAKEKDSETGLSYFGSRYYSSDLSIWLSVDPMAAKYPGLGPYVYCADNPVKLVDPNGEEVYLVGEENAIALAIEHISNHSKLNISINEEGRLEAKGIAWTKTDRAIKRACRDERVQLFMHCKDENSFLWSDGSTLPTENGGGYNGNFFDDYLLIAQQNVCPSKLAEFDKSVGDKRPGLTMIHELLEGYLGGLIAVKTGKESSRAGVEGSTYEQAHHAASKYVGGNRGPLIENQYRITINWGKWPNLFPSVTVSTQEVVVGYHRTNE